MSNHTHNPNSPIRCKRCGAEMTCPCSGNSDERKPFPPEYYTRILPRITVCYMADRLYEKTLRNVTEQQASRILSEYAAAIEAKRAKRQKGKSKTPATDGKRQPADEDKEAPYTVIR